MIAVTAATGKTGQAITRAATAAGLPMRAVIHTDGWRRACLRHVVDPERAVSGTAARSPVQETERDEVDDAQHRDRQPEHVRPGVRRQKCVDDHRGRVRHNGEQDHDRD